MRFQPTLNQGDSCFKFLSIICYSLTSASKTTPISNYAIYSSYSILKRGILFTNQIMSGPSGKNIPLDLLGRYQDISLIGQGGMGFVYKAKDSVLQRTVAIKTLLPGMENEALIRFQKEAKASGNLKHINILDILDFGISSNQEPYLIMEYLQGKSLRQMLNQGPLKIECTISIAIQICKGINHAHKNGVIHRDLKPSNIIVQRDSTKDEKTVKIIDFGIAHMRKSKDSGFESTGKKVVGSPAYMAPEIAKGEGATFQSDIYSLGCMLFECLTGRPPFLADSNIELLKQHIEAAPPELSSLLSHESDYFETIEPTIRKCLQKSPDKRFESARDLEIELSKIMSKLFGEASIPAESIPQYANQSQYNWFSKTNLAIIAGLVSFGLLAVGYFNSQVNRNKITEASQHKIEAPKSSLQVKKTLDGLSNSYFGGTNEVTEEEIINGTASGFEEKKLLLGNNTNITDRALQSLNGKTLYEIDVSYTKVTDKGVAALHNVKYLGVLKLDGLESISYKGFAPFKENRDLSYLSLNSTPITDQSLKAISEIESITTLSFSGCKNITDKGIGYLKALPNLGNLSVSNTGISAKAVSELTHLYLLRAKFCEFNDADIELLAKNELLSNLSIRGCPITDKSLNILAKHPRLKELHIVNCNQLTKGAIKKFKIAKPNCDLDDYFME